MHVTYAGKSMFTGDAAANALVEYAAALAHARDADSVRVRIVGPDGNEAEAHFLLDTGAPLMAESTNSNFPMPENAEVVEYMRRKTRQLMNPPPISPGGQGIPAFDDDWNL